MKKQLWLLSLIALSLSQAVLADDCSDLQYANGTYLKPDPNMPVLYYPDGSVMGNSEFLMYPDGQVLKDHGTIYYPNGQIYADDRYSPATSNRMQLPDLFYPDGQKLFENGFFYNQSRYGSRQSIIGRSDYGGRISLKTDPSGSSNSYGALQLRYGTSAGDIWVTEVDSTVANYPWIDLRTGSGGRTTRIQLSRLVLNTGRVVLRMDDTYGSWGNRPNVGWKTSVVVEYKNARFQFICTTSPR